MTSLTEERLLGLNPGDVFIFFKGDLPRPKDSATPLHDLLIRSIFATARALEERGQIETWEREIAISARRGATTEIIRVVEHHAVGLIQKVER